MTLDRSALRRAGTALAYGLLGAVGTAAVVLPLMVFGRPVQPLVYDLLYARLGPSEATETAVLTHSLLVIVVAVAVPTLVGDYLSDRLAHRAAFARLLVALLASVAGFLVAALAGLAGYLTAVAALAVVLLVAPVALRYRYGVRSGGVPAVVGAIPVVVFLLLLTGFGLGWGWGYVVTAEEVPASSVEGEVVDLGSHPEIRNDLFEAGNCEANASGGETCILSLRGYERERAVARFLDRHSVRCPYSGRAGSGGVAYVRHDGRHYRVTCTPHGD